eukprot:gene6886-4913_t
MLLFSYLNKKPLDKYDLFSNSHPSRADVSNVNDEHIDLAPLGVEALGSSRFSSPRLLPRCAAAVAASGRRLDLSRRDGGIDDGWTSGGHAAYSSSAYAPQKHRLMGKYSGLDMEADIFLSHLIITILITIIMFHLSTLDNYSDNNIISITTDYNNFRIIIISYFSYTNLFYLIKPSDLLHFEIIKFIVFRIIFHHVLILLLNCFSKPVVIAPWSVDKLLEAARYLKPLDEIIIGRRKVGTNAVQIKWSSGFSFRFFREMPEVFSGRFRSRIISFSYVLTSFYFGTFVAFSCFN